ncbi:Uncharacterised protein [Bordetella pertussis]|nr:Uncharacterised protein [Bordetella pertussis]
MGATPWRLRVNSCTPSRFSMSLSMAVAAGWLMLSRRAALRSVPSCSRYWMRAMWRNFRCESAASERWTMAEEGERYWLSHKRIF